MTNQILVSFAIAVVLLSSAVPFGVSVQNSCQTIFENEDEWHDSIFYKNGKTLEETRKLCTEETGFATILFLIPFAVLLGVTGYTYLRLRRPAKNRSGSQ